MYPDKEKLNARSIVDPQTTIQTFITYIPFNKNKTNINKKEPPVYRLLCRLGFCYSSIIVHDGPMYSLVTSKPLFRYDDTLQSKNRKHIYDFCRRRGHSPLRTLLCSNLPLYYPHFVLSTSPVSSLVQLPKIITKIPAFQDSSSSDIIIISLVIALQLRHTLPQTSPECLYQLPLNSPVSQQQQPTTQSPLPSILLLS